MSASRTRLELARYLARLWPAEAPLEHRRRFLRQAAMAVCGVGISPLLRAATPERPRFTQNPFTLGVASGYPGPASVVLWTRLACEPLGGGGIEDPKLPVRVEIAEDASFRRGLRQETLTVYADLAHSLHWQPQGLQPDREYHYRFHCGDWSSISGRTRTAPAVDALPRRLRLALASCQHYEQGWFSPYRQILADQPDLIVFVGDYIYENSWGNRRIRRHHGSDPMDLQGYRTRHAQYKLDPDLQAAHASVPWLLTWDDHEVANDYAGARTESLDPQFLLRRAAAYQAYYEHLPLPPAMRPGPHDMRIYHAHDHGQLARILMLDNRQYRTPQPCPSPNRGGSSTVRLSACPELEDPQASMLGPMQEAWLAQRVEENHAPWTILGQQTLFSPLIQPVEGGSGVWTDAWDGYPAARTRLLHSLARNPSSTPLILGGDVHAYYVNDVPPLAAGQEQPAALELCTTSLNAEGLDQSLYDTWRSQNAHVHLARSDVRGYTLVELDRDRVQARLQITTDVHAAHPTRSTLAQFQASRGRGWEP